MEKGIITTDVCVIKHIYSTVDIKYVYCVLNSNNLNLIYGGLNGNKTL